MQNERFDTVIVGAGFAGLYMLHKLRRAGRSAIVLEAGSGVGGTWFWNRYPGCRCDVESMQYSYSFSDELEQEWRWSERFAAQPEILRYAEHVAERFSLSPHIRLNTRVVAARYNEAACRWTLETEQGDRIEAPFCIMATGCLSAGRTPDLPGLAQFEGETYHTADWPPEGVDLAGKRIGVIGTGSSGIQAIPELARQAGHLFVFQRTPNYSVPARNGPLQPEYEADWKSRYPALREEARFSNSGTLYDNGPSSALDVSPDERDRVYRARWEVGGPNFLRAFNDLAVDQQANDTAAEFVRARIGEIVHDPAVAAKLMPQGYPIGTKRICVDSGYFETFNRPNVTLIDLREEPLDSIEADGVRTGARSIPLDVIVFATGFDAVTGALTRMAVIGRGGMKLADKWAAGPRTYLGLMTAGFPNMFMITGPGSPSVLSNMLVSIEQHVDWIADCIEFVGERVIEADGTAETEWVEHVNVVANQTLYPRAASWYMGANIPGKPRVFMPYIGGVGPYRKRCNEVAANGYDGFVLSTAAVFEDAG
ncbi:MAG: NAD(P)/FAD-dependent oxidoreductase [Pseudomonadota bacterium]|nr:NAD(P)/FAD-dependent oxidoreductase [Pseudomonadota bacterium]